MGAHELHAGPQVPALLIPRQGSEPELGDALEHGGTGGLGRHLPQGPLGNLQLKYPGNPPGDDYLFAVIPMHFICHTQVRRKVFFEILP